MLSFHKWRVKQKYETQFNFDKIFGIRDFYTC